MRHVSSLSRGTGHSTADSNGFGELLIISTKTVLLIFHVVNDEDEMGIDFVSLIKLMQY